MPRSQHRSHRVTLLEAYYLLDYMLRRDVLLVFSTFLRLFFCVCSTMLGSAEDSLSGPGDEFF